MRKSERILSALQKLKENLIWHGVKQEELEAQYLVLSESGKYTSREIAFHMARFAEARTRGSIRRALAEIK